MMKLKAKEEIVDRYYNDGNFQHSIEYIISNHYDSAFGFYEEFSSFWEEEGYHRISNSRNKLYEIFLEFYKSKSYGDLNVFNEFLKLDFIQNNKNGNLPKKLKRSKNNLDQRQVHQVLKDERLLKAYLPEYEDIPTKRLIRNVSIERFEVNLFKIMENGYNLIEDENHVDILFIYREGVINRCDLQDISKITRELE